MISVRREAMCPFCNRRCQVKSSGVAMPHPAKDVVRDNGQSLGPRCEGVGKVIAKDVRMPPRPVDRIATIRAAVRKTSG